MAVATTTALLIGAGIAGGAQIAGAKMASNAANKAAGQQTQATDQGLALQERIYGQQVAGMQPYAAAGQQALGSLGSLMGFPALPAATPGERPPMSSAQGPLTPAQLAIRPMMVGPDGKPLGLPGQGTLGSAMSGNTGQSSYGGGRSGPPQGVGGSMPAPGPAMISVMSPDGEVGQIPEAQWPQAQAAGGRRVG